MAQSVSVSPKRIEGLKPRSRPPCGMRAMPVSVSPKRIEGLKPGRGGVQSLDERDRFQYPLSGSKD